MGLKQLGLGINLGRVGLGLDELYVHASYVFTISEREDAGGTETADLNLTRSESLVTSSR